MCKIAKARSPVELLQIMARAEPNGIAQAALRNIVFIKQSIGEMSGRSISASNSARVSHTRYGSARERPSNGIIPEENQEVDQSYDENDPDIKMLQKYERKENQTPKGQDDQVQDEFVVKLEDAGYDKDFAEFDRLAAKNSSLGERRVIRDIRSAYPLNRDLEDGITTVPITAPTSKKVRANLNIMSARSHSTAKSYDYPACMNIVGRPMSFASRPAQPSGSPIHHIISIGPSQKTPKDSLIRSPTINKPVMIASRVQTRPMFEPASATRRSIASTLPANLMYSSRPDLHETDKNSNQIQTHPTSASIRPEDRPNTAGVRTSLAAQMQRSPLTRPMTAGGFWMTRKEGAYLVNNRMRCNDKRKRPISAAVNTVINSGKGRAFKVNPKKTKRKYERYLKELEREAKRFVLEEGSHHNNQSASKQDEEGDAAAPEGKTERKILLNEAKVQRKRVRLRKEGTKGAPKKLNMISIKGNNPVLASSKSEISL